MCFVLQLIPRSMCADFACCCVDKPYSCVPCVPTTVPARVIVVRRRDGGSLPLMNQCGGDALKQWRLRLGKDLTRDTKVRTCSRPITRGLQLDIHCLMIRWKQTPGWQLLAAERNLGTHDMPA